MKSEVNVGSRCGEGRRKGKSHAASTPHPLVLSITAEGDNLACYRHQLPLNPGMERIVGQRELARHRRLLLAFDDEALDSPKHKRSRSLLPGQKAESSRHRSAGRAVRPKT